MIESEILEEDLRTASFCSKLYSLKGNLDFRDEVQIACKETMEKLILFQLKHGADADYDEFLLNTINESVSRIVRFRKVNEENYYETFDLYRRKVFHWITDWFKTFPSKSYVPVLGHYRARIQISSTVIELDISGIYKDVRTQSMHIITFYNDLKNSNPWYDLASIAKILFGRNHFNFANNAVHLHCIDTWYDTKYKGISGLIYKKISSKDLTSELKEYLLTEIKFLENIKQPHRIPSCKWFDCPKRKECIKDESR
jgi:hypothetical protein